VLLGPFRGSDALARGLITRGVLYGPRYRALYPDVHVHVQAPVDLALRSCAAHLLVAPDGALAGYSAAEMLGASSGAEDAPAEVVLLNGRRRRPFPGLVVHRDTVRTDELIEVGGLLMTTPLRTAYDLARWASSLTEAVVAVDALAHRHRVPVHAIAGTGQPGARGRARLARVVDLVDSRAESPMESRIRLAIVLGGLPAPVPQYPVLGYRLDLAYPTLRLAFEYNGGHHLTQSRTRRDLEREHVLARAGWTIVRFDAAAVLRHPWSIVTRVRRELVNRGVEA
jgi:very-short-patch-repair endonuclease